ncbi:transcriptional regulator [Capsulimonas corticalis]|uniref:Transcriptional regulator n=1 Tax=Capsulimonas corticalis TaxID=2219043 RepID=A0A402CU76_9BACT|nr:AraC family transcriptional regulator [Capsulimonas corticalis]BDI28867.1 transcriptional regulator [Capsulimonas corticalis]
MTNNDILPLDISAIHQRGAASPIHAGDAGQFLSRGIGRHPSRILSHFDLIYVQSGVLRIQEDSAAFEVKGGESLLLWPGRRHWGTEDYPPDLAFYWLHFAIRTDESDPQISPAISVPQHAVVARPRQLTELFRRYLDDQESPDRDQLSADLMVSLILCEISRAIRSGTEPVVERSPLANLAKQFIQANSHLPITTSSIAKSIDVNPNYLSRIFRRDFGITVTDAIHQSRMAQARFYLMENDYNVETIARLCGYDSAIYFRRVFHRLHAMSPLEYRRLYLKVHVIGY